ncbi:MAG: SWIM zinc finger family protein [PVC group bacterium]
MKLLRLSSAILGAGFIFMGMARAADAPAAPEELNQKAYFLIREARKAIYQKEDRLAYDKFMEAIAIYEDLFRLYPDWQPETIRIKIEQCREEADTIGRRVFKLPDGYIEIAPGMIREGDRYDKGRIDAARIKKIDENHYEVGEYTVTLVREGPLLGASCSGPDYTYRGRKLGFACRHIWAVLLKENLLKEQ